jgi:hypothetical protein
MIDKESEIKPAVCNQHKEGPQPATATVPAPYPSVPLAYMCACNNTSAQTKQMQPLPACQQRQLQHLTQAPLPTTAPPKHHHLCRSLTGLSLSSVTSVHTDASLRPSSSSSNKDAWSQCVGRSSWEAPKPQKPITSKLLNLATLLRSSNRLL